VPFEQFVAEQNQRVFDIWSDVFAGQTGRLVRVVAGFELNPAYTARVLQHMNGDFDAVSCAAYFGPDAATRATYSASTTADQVMDDTIASIPTALNYLALHRALADQYAQALGRPIQLVAYEGGPHLDGRNQPYQPAFLAAGLDPRMYDAYRDLVVGAYQVGLDLFMQYEFTGRQVPNPFGVFGVLNYMDQPTAEAPKYRALLDAIAGQFRMGPTPGPNAPPPGLRWAGIPELAGPPGETPHSPYPLGQEPGGQSGVQGALPPAPQTAVPEARAAVGQGAGPGGVRRGSGHDGWLTGRLGGADEEPLTQQPFQGA
jgi:hypothetical protein